MAQPTVPTLDELLRPRQKPVAKAAAPVTTGAPKLQDPYEMKLQREQQRNAEYAAMGYGGPDKAARARQVSRETGVPLDYAASNLDHFERTGSINRLMGLGTTYQAFGPWLGDPNNAVVAQDDYDSLSMLGKLWYGTTDFLGNIPEMGEAIVKSGYSGLVSAGAFLDDALAYVSYVPDAAATTLLNMFGFTDFTARKNQYGENDPDERLAGRLERNRASVKFAAQSAQEAVPTSESYFVSQAMAGISGLGTTLVGVGAGVITGNPAVGASVIGAQVGTGAYYEGIDQGLSRGAALSYGVRQGSIEYLTEKIPVGRLLMDLEKGAPLTKVLFNQIVAEVPQEQAATFLQDLNDWATLNPDKTLKDFAMERPQAALDTLIQTVAGAGALTGITVGVDRTVRAAEKVSVRFQEAQAAGQEGRFLNRLMTAAKGSKLRSRDPVAFEGLMQSMAEDQGADNLFVDGRAMLEYMQSDQYEPLANEWLETWRDDAVEAAAIGGDVVLPMGQAMAHMPDKGIWEALGKHSRTSPGGVTQSEAEMFNEAMAQVVQDLADQMADNDKAAMAELEPVAKLEQSITDKLMNAGFTPSAARAQAALLTQRYSTRAARLGGQVTGGEFDGIEVNRVLPEGLAKARALDNIDMVINAMRRGKNPQVKRGKSLLEWIADRGGIEDRGGELAAMGADRWHLLATPKKGVNKKGKAYTAKTEPGRRKLLKDFIEGQGSMIGGASTANSLDMTLQAAIAEGFFPDLTVEQQGEERTYADLVDTQVLLDAIADELAGNPIYMEGAAPVMDDTRLAAQELDEILTSRGLDANTMTDKQIRDALSAYQAEQEGGRGYDQMPDTIEIDGIERPTRNSNGQPVAQTAEGVRNFWAWFGDSKVVDDEGRPLVVYHGTSEKFDAFDVSKIGRNATALGYGFYFAEREDVAKGYQTEGGDLLPVYLAASKPVENEAPIKKTDAKKLVRKAVEIEIAETPDEIESYRDGFLSNVVDTYSTSFDAAVAEAADMLANNDTMVDAMAELANIMGSKELAFRASIEGLGVDAIHVPDFQEGDGQVWVMFDPTRIKSVNNRGTFDPADARILYQSGFDLSPRASGSMRVGDASIEYRVSSDGTYAEIAKVFVPEDKRKSGAARAAVQSFLAESDAKGLTVFLTPDPIGKGGASKAALSSFYKSLGFKDNKGKGKDFRSQQSMIREPQRSLFQPAYHGSPHIFDKFSLDAIGTGEGAQAYGYGLYFAGKKEIAEYYRDTLKNRGINFRQNGSEALERAGVPVSDQAITSLLQYSSRVDRGEETLERAAVKMGWQSIDIRELSDAAKVELLKDYRSTLNKGRLYEVEIPDDGEYLLWDKPLSEQPDDVWDNVVRAADSISDDAGGAELRDMFELGDVTGSEAYRFLAETYAKGFMPDGIGGQWLNAGSGAKAASEILRDAGIAGIKYLDGNSRSASDGSYNYVVFDDNAVSIRAYEQAQQDGARGRILFPMSAFNNRATIELFQNANLSTMLHETGHLWLEELKFDAADPNAPQQLKDDLQTVFDWFAANGHAVGPDGTIPTEAHEMWARGVEQYLMEGKAPVAGLQSVFDTFKRWLVTVYKTIAALRSPVSPEIRGVMDRLIATDEEIAAAQESQFLTATFKSAEEAGMTKSEFAAYQDAITNARNAARETLLAKTTREIRARETKQYREWAAAMRSEVIEALDRTPRYRAIASMELTPLDAAQIKEMFGEDAVSMLPKRVPPLYTNKNGADMNVVAELAGFTSGEAMLRDLMAMEVERRAMREGGDKRTVREATIARQVEERMRERYGDPLNDGTIEREAIAAVHNELQGELLSMESRAISRRAGSGTAIPYKVARDWAREKVRAGQIAEFTSNAALARYRRAAEKAGREAEQAMAKRDDAALFAAKQAQLVNSALLAEASAAKAEIDSALKRLERVAKKRTMKSVDQDYLEQAQALLEGIELRERSQASINRQGKWEEWAREREAEGHEIIVPASFEAALGQRNWSRLTVDELLGLDEAIKQIMHLGKLKQTLIDNKEEREFEAVVNDAVRAADAIGRKPPKDGFADPTTWDGVKSKVLSMDAMLLKMEPVIDWLDGGNSNGVFNRIVFRPIADAQAREQDMLKDYYGRVKEVMSDVPPKVLRGWAEKVDTDLLNRDTGQPISMPRHKLVAMALNWGNAGNRQRLVDGYGWNEQAVERTIMDNLTQEEWQFVQKIWDVIDTLWPEIAAMERRVNGVEPEKVEAVEVETPFGTLRGGYYPAIYDSTKDYRSEELEGAASELFTKGYVRSTTRASSTKERSEKVKRPILLDIGVINRHLGEVIHDLTHREAIMQAHKFVTNPRVMQAIDDTLGVEIRKQFRPWLAHVSNSWAADRAGNEGFAKWLTQLRLNTSIVGLGLRISTVLMQVGGYANSFEYVGEKWIAQGMARVAASPIETFKFVMERSDEVRNRMDTLDRDIRNEVNRLAAPTIKSKAGEVLTVPKRLAFHGIGYMDRVVVIPTWLGAYNKALSEGMDEREAAYAADKAVRLSQGAGSPKDLAAVARGDGRMGELLKWLTVFYSYMSTVYSRQRTFARDVKSAGVRDVPRLVMRSWWLFVVAPLFPELLKAAMGSGGPGDDEEWGWFALKKILGQSLGAIPLVRDAFEPTWNAVAGVNGFDYSLSPVQRAVESGVNTARDVSKVAQGEETKRMTRNTLETVGYFTGLVPGQVAASAQFWVDLSYGEVEPKTAGDWVEGISTGRIKEDEE